MCLKSKRSDLITPEKPEKIDFIVAAIRIDQYFDTVPASTAHTRACGFVDGLLFNQSVSDSDGSRLYAYAGQIYAQKTKN
jgi:hypothetical protein